MQINLSVLVSEFTLLLKLIWIISKMLRLNLFFFTSKILTLSNPNWCSVCRWCKNKALTSLLLLLLWCLTQVLLSLTNRWLVAWTRNFINYIFVITCFCCYYSHYFYSYIHADRIFLPIYCLVWPINGSLHELEIL